MNSYTKYCKCGFPVWITQRWNGFVWVNHYHDVIKDGMSPHEITHCPDCGEQLRNEALVELGELDL